MVAFSNINLVIAHKLEAEHLIHGFALEAVESDNYQLYRNQEGMQAIICGMGYDNARAATEYLASLDLHFAEARGWLNVGIAGHQSAGLGSCLVANRIVHKATGKCAYPALIFTEPGSSEVMTVDRPELEYPQDIAYEMEAAGFWAAAVRHTSLEFVQCLKIISDNKSHSTDKITPKQIRMIMRNNFEIIKQCCARLQKLVEEYNEPSRVGEVVASLIERHHFTVTQQHQLKRLWQRYNALGKKRDFDEIVSQTHSSGKKIINERDEKIKV